MKMSQNETVGTTNYVQSYKSVPYIEKIYLEKHNPSYF